MGLRFRKRKASSSLMVMHHRVSMSRGTPPGKAFGVVHHWIEVIETSGRAEEKSGGTVYWTIVKAF